MLWSCSGHFSVQPVDVMDVIGDRAPKASYQGHQQVGFYFIDANTHKHTYTTHTPHMQANAHIYIPKLAHKRLQVKYLRAKNRNSSPHPQQRHTHTHLLSHTSEQSERSRALAAHPPPLSPSLIWFHIQKYKTHTHATHAYYIYSKHTHTHMHKEWRGESCFCIEALCKHLSVMYQLRWIQTKQNLFLQFLLQSVSVCFTSQCELCEATLDSAVRW